MLSMVTLKNFKSYTEKKYIMKREKLKSKLCFYLIMVNFNWTSLANNLFQIKVLMLEQNMYNCRYYHVSEQEVLSCLALPILQAMHVIRAPYNFTWKTLSP